MQDTINFLKAISDKNRLSILFILSKNTLCVCDLLQIIPITQGALSIQLTSLAKLNLLQSTKKGKWSFYALSDDIKPEYLQILLKIFNEIKDDPTIISAMDNSVKYNKTNIC